MAATKKHSYSWAAYKAIEEDMLRVIEYVPLETRQYDVHSFKLTDIIIRSCSHIDSLFKDVLRNQDLSKHPNQQKIAKSREILVGAQKGMLTITDYIGIFAKYLNLEPVEVFIRRNNDKIMPFKEFKSSTPEYKASPWWGAYNALKHDFYSEVEKGTLLNALESLGALFALNCKIPFHFKLEENIHYLVSNGVITSPNFVHVGYLLKYIKEDPKLGKYSLVATTDLFEYWLSYNEKTIGLTSIPELDVPRLLRIPRERPPGL